ncbi:12105_t:CDS:2, partial [Rhizophagus irregularis]
MDSDEEPDELRDLTEVKEIYLSLLDVLVICHQSASNAEAFRDFKVHCGKVTQA